jgi:hypothetical protein
MAGQSLLTVAGWWVAWVYALSLSLPVLLGPLPPPPRPVDFDEDFRKWAREVVFKSSGIIVSQADPAGLAKLTAVATSPAPVSGDVEVFVEEMTAKDGVDFEKAKRGVKIHFEKGAVEGTLRFDPKWGPDIRIVDSKQRKEPRSLRLRLKSGPDAVAAGDMAMCTVTIDDGPMPYPKAALIPVGFARDSMPLILKDLATTPFEVKAAAAVAEPVPVKFSLFHTRDGVRRPLGRFERTLATGDSRTAFRLADVFSPGELEKFGLTDMGRPGRDETYEIDLMAPPPLFPDAASRICRIVAENTNAPPDTRTMFFNSKGEEIPYLDPDGGSIAVEYNGAMTNDSEQVVTINGQPVGVAKVPAGSRRSQPISLADCQGLAGMDGRKCGVATQPGPGCCKGQKGGAGRALCGEPVPGDYMLIVVNNERLHDPNDGIVAEVKRALADESAKPYGHGAIILNPDDEDSLTPTGGEPDPKKMFQPYNKEKHDVAGQLKRIEEVVARKREAAANPNLRAVVVWPERDLAAGAGVRPVAGPDLQPMSFLLPDAAPSYARTVEQGLMPANVGPRDVTVRAPKERELQAHLVNVIAEGRTAAGDSPK